MTSSATLEVRPSTVGVDCNPGRHQAFAGRGLFHIKSSASRIHSAAAIAMARAMHWRRASVAHCSSVTEFPLSQDEVDYAALSRTGTTGALGKLTEELKVRISYPTLDGLRRLAAEHDMPLAEYVRMKLDCDVHGADHVANVMADRVRRVAGTGA